MNPIQYAPVFTKKRLQWLAGGMVALFIVGTFFDEALSRLVAQDNSYWATFLQDGGAIPNVIVTVLAFEILFQKASRSLHGWVKVLAQVLAFATAFGRFWSYYIEAIGQFGQSLLNAQKGVSVGVANDYVFLVKNNPSGWLFVVCSLLGYGIFHWLIQRFWLRRLTLKWLDQLVLIGFIGIVADTLSSNTVNMIKDAVSRPRPYLALAGKAAYTPWFHINGMLDSGDYTSFPSGHTRCFFMSFFFPFFVEPVQKRLRQGLFYFAVGYSFLGAFSRMVLEKHYLTDVMMGGGLALVTIWLCVTLTKIEQSAPVAE